MSRTVVQPHAPLLAKVAWFFAAVFSVALLVAITPAVLDTLAAFGVISPPKSLAIPTPIVTIRDLSVPAAAPPATSQEPPGAPIRQNSAPAAVPPVSAATPAPAVPGITVIVVKPSSGAPIVVREGMKYRSAP